MTQTTDTTLPYTVTGVPRIINGKVIIGNGGAEYRVAATSRPMTLKPANRLALVGTCPATPPSPTNNRNWREAAKDLDRRVLEDRRRRHRLGRHGL
jgi:quinohemoprotein ethanol dehydrogenase